MTTPSTIEVTNLTLTDAGRLVASGSATPSELLEAYLARIDSIEPQIQAWSVLDKDGARAEAARLTAEAKSGQLRGPLHGVPVGVKDEFHVAGMVTEMAGNKGRPEAEDAAAVTRLREAGAIILGKTHMPVDGRMPPTHNPWNLAHTAGGTSSGSGAAVGARMVPFTLGGQTYGSNLRPAAYCGVDGMKPTYGRISRRGCYPFTWSLDHVGLIGLTMEDIRLVLSAIGGPNPKDASGGPEPGSVQPHAGSIRPPRIGVVRNFFPERTEPIMLEAIERCAKSLNEAGAAVSDVLLPEDFGLLWQIQPVVGSPESATFRSRRYQGEDPERPPVRDRVAAQLPATYYLQAQRIRRWLWQRVQGSLTEFDALLMAIAPGAAPKGFASAGDPSLLVPWSCLGYPAITINGGLAPDGLPLGLQLVGRPAADYELMGTGAWCESVLGRLPAPALAT
jgi:aspartyl-tRNA(Asn)/glutamyl-tRNA(Gln) amidotransferase subunit A